MAAAARQKLTAAIAFLERLHLLAAAAAEAVEHLPRQVQAAAAAAGMAMLRALLLGPQAQAGKAIQVAITPRGRRMVLVAAAAQGQSRDGD